MKYVTYFHGIKWAKRPCWYVMDDFGTLVKVPETLYFPNKQRH